MNRFEHVFVVVPDCHARTGHYGALWREHFVEGVQRVVPSTRTPEGLDFSWARDGTASEALRLETSARLEALIRAAHAERNLSLVLSYCFSADLDLGMVARVRRLGVPWVNFFCDSTHRFGEVRELAAAVDANWFPESEAEPQYEALGVRHLRAPYAMNPDHLPDLNCGVSERLAGFVGVPSSNRITRLGWLALLGCPVTARGRGWVGDGADPFGSSVAAPKRLAAALFKRGLLEKALRRVLWPMVRKRAGGALDAAGFRAFVSGCRVLVGLNEGRDEAGHLRSYLKFRDIEFPGYGCCYLTQRNPDVEAALIPGREVLVARSTLEAAALMRRAAREPDWAREIGKAGRRRVLEEHTWPARLGALREVLDRS